MWKSNRRAKLINHQNMNLLENRKWQNINIWKDNWIPHQFEFKVLTRKPLESDILSIRDLLCGQKLLEPIENSFLLTKRWYNHWKP
jgi:hypothetical protein